MKPPKKHITKPHDHFFRMMMSDKRVAREFFEAYLPKELEDTRQYVIHYLFRPNFLSV